MTESFFHSLKTELVYFEKFQTRQGFGGKSVVACPGDQNDDLAVAVMNPTAYFDTVEMAK